MTILNVNVKVKLIIGGQSENVQFFLEAHIVKRCHIANEVYVVEVLLKIYI